MALIRTNKALTDDPKNAFDDRNAEARKHEGHKLIILRHFHRPHPTTNGYNEHDVICEDCKVQFKAYNWHEHTAKPAVPETEEAP